jgi:hypothetical protein
MLLAVMTLETEGGYTFSLLASLFLFEKTDPDIL